MGRILAIDYGTKRTGIAVTDPLQIIASGLTTVDTSELLAFLKNYIATENVEQIVIGDPKTLKNENGIVENHIQKFINTFAKIFPSINICRVDERFTSKIASQSLIESGAKKKTRQNKKMIDQISATLILQSYLYHK